VNVQDLLDPEIEPLLALIPFSTLDAETLPTVRDLMGIEMEMSGAVDCSDHVVPGDPPVRVRVYRPKGVEGTLPCLYSMHGGGYVLGRHTMEDLLFDRWCPQLGIVGVSVDYRLAPETPYPGPIEDCYAGLRWVHEHAGELGVDPACVGVHGLSAGGGLAAALALLARDRGGPPIKFQVLVAPMLDDRQVTGSSQLDGLPVWSRESNTFGWRSYLGELYGRDDVPYHAAPARTTDLSGLPPTFVSVGALDGFRDEDVDYALRLNQAGVPAELHVYPGAPHGLQIATESDVCRRSNRDTEEWVAAQLRRYQAEQDGQQDGQDRQEGTA
jgi:acetyl esterase/lipase